MANRTVKELFDEINSLDKWDMADLVEALEKNSVFLKNAVCGLPSWWMTGFLFWYTTLSLPDSP